MITKKNALLAIIAILFSACVKNDNFDPDKISGTGIEPTLPIPLGKANINFKNLDISKDPSIRADCDTCIVSIFVSNDLFSYSPKELMKIGNQLAPQIIIDGPPDVSNTGIYKLPTITTPIELSGLDNGIKLSSVTLESGKTELKFNYDLAHPSDITFTIPEAKKDGKSFSELIPNVTKNTSIKTFSLDGYTINMVNNSFSTTVEATLNTNVAKTSTTSNDLVIDLSITNLVPSQTKGFLGNQPLDFPSGEFAVDISNGIFKDVTLNLKEPLIKIKLENSGLDIPLSGNLTNFEAIGNKTTKIIVSNDILKDAKVDSKTEVILDKNTPGFIDAISSNPTKFVYTFTGETNNGKTSGNNTLNSNGSLSGKMDLILPLKGFAEGIYMRDTIDFNLGENLDKISSLEIVLDIDNGFPISVGALELYTMDNSGKVDYLTTIKDFLLAEISDDGKITPQKSKTSAVIGPDKMLLFKAANKLIISGKVIAGTSKASITIRPSNYMKINIGVNAKFKL